MKFTAKKDFKDFKGEIKAGDAIELTELSRINALRRLGLIGDYSEPVKVEVEVKQEKTSKKKSKPMDLKSEITVGEVVDGNK